MYNLATIPHDIITKASTVPGDDVARAVLALHVHRHLDHNDMPTTDPAAVRTARCGTCGNLTRGHLWCATVTAIAALRGLDLHQQALVAARQAAIERRADQICAQLSHHHEGGPQCAGYQQAVTEIDVHGAG